jgi:hypothetical protein
VDIGVRGGQVDLGSQRSRKQVILRIQKGCGRRKILGGFGGGRGTCWIPSGTIVDALIHHLMTCFQDGSIHLYLSTRISDRSSASLVLRSRRWT